MLLRILISLAVAAVIGGLMRLFAWMIDRATAARPGEYRLSPIVGACGMLSGAFGGMTLGMGILGNVTPARDDFIAWVALCVTFGLFGLGMTIAAGNWRMWQSDEGIQIRNELGLLGPFTPWKTITRVRVNMAQTVAFSRRDGGSLKIASGTPGLLEAVVAAHRHGAQVEEPLLEEMKLATRPDA